MQYDIYQREYIKVMLIMGISNENLRLLKTITAYYSGGEIVNGTENTTLMCKVNVLLGRGQHRL